MRRLFCALVAVACFFIPHISHAAAYTFDRFTAAYNIASDGTISITEDFDLTFTEARHGLLWHVPTRYTTNTGDRRAIRLRVVGVTDAEDEPVKHTVDYGGGQVTLKIGDPDVTITGPTHYRVRWVLTRAWNFFDDHDELYWNVISDDQEAPPERVTAVIEPPAGVAVDSVKSVCYAGPRGSTDTANCVTAQSDNTLVFASTEPMTLVLGFPVGTITRPTTQNRVWWFVEDNWFVALPIFALFLLFAIWWRHGRDPKGRGTIIAEYEPPEGMDPMTMSALLKASVDHKDVTAGIIDLAVRGYVVIEPKGDTDKPKSFVLVRQKLPGSELPEPERMVMNDLFEKGDRLDLSEKQSRLVKTFALVGNHINKTLTTEQYFVRDPGKVRGLFILLAFVMGMVPIWFHLGGATIIAGIVIGIEVAIFGWFMPKVTRKGAIAREKALGFKLFLDTAERDRLKWQEQQGLFEKFLPYAIVFGVTKHWAAAFAGSYQAQPSWYHGSAWNAVLFADQITALDKNMVSAVHPASGGSGFSGGSSGGGFGGGGGGSW